jgi:hypothetical protein
MSAYISIPAGVDRLLFRASYAAKKRPQKRRGSPITCT